MLSNQSVFLSYAKEDVEYAEKLYNALKSNGIITWFDRAHILPGQDWKYEIHKAIKNSAYFIALLSPNSISKKGFVQKELKMALDILKEFPPSSIYIIPARIADCSSAYKEFESLQWVDLFPSFERGIAKILRVFKSEEERLGTDLSEIERVEKHKPDHILIQIQSKKDWATFLDSCEGYLIENDFNKIYNFLKKPVKSILIEKEYFDPDYHDTYSNFFSHKFANYPDKTIRAHFFSRRIPYEMLFDLDNYQENYIGFSVIRPNRVASIGSTILNPKLMGNVRGKVCLGKYPVNLLGAELIAEGFPYMSQDSDVTTSPHAACWMIFRYLSYKYTRYPEKYPYEVTQLVNKALIGRANISKGLTVEEVRELFSNYGLYPELYSRHVSKYGSAFDELLYQYVDSGLPVFAGLSKMAHAVTIIGYISDFSNEDKSVSSSARYLSAFVANDDKQMPYITIRKFDSKPNRHCSDYRIGDIDFFIVPLFEEIGLLAEHVNDLADALLSDGTLGINNRSNILKYNQIITRTFLTISTSYKKYIRKESIPFGISRAYAELPMPKLIWVCEISTPDLYANGKVLGEIIFDSTANPYDRLSFLAIHYPDFFLLNDRNSITDNPERFQIFKVEDQLAISYNSCVNDLTLV